MSGLAGGLAALLVGVAMMANGAGIVPAAAVPGAYLQLVKQVDGQDAHRGLSPGQSVTFRVEFSSENYTTSGPVTLTDVMPAAFAGWEISEIAASLPGHAGATTVTLPGISPATSGTIGQSEAERTISVDIAATDGEGGTGLPSGTQGWLEYTVTVPVDLSPEWEFVSEDLVNHAEITGTEAPGTEISADDSAVISVDVTRTVDVKPTKSWSPERQSYEPGAESTISIGATQASNVKAEKLTLQDHSGAQDGAAALAQSNPFRYVAFAGFTSDPLDAANWPEGATSATVEVYVFDGSTWNWVAYDADSIDDADIAGVRLGYTGDIAPQAKVAQSFTVVQREADLLGETELPRGYQATNEVAATVVATGADPVTKQADADLTIAPVSIAVRAGKVFLDAAGTEVDKLSTTAGNTVGVILTAQNGAADESAELDSLTISDPGEGAHAGYFSEDLAFAGFDPDSSAQVWPAGATGGTLTWLRDGAPIVVTLTAGQALPAAPAGVDITGFTIAFTGKIAPGATSRVQYDIRTSEDLASDGAQAGPFTNVVDVEGTRPGVAEPAADTDAADLSVVSPSIAVDIEKKVSPSIVFPGDDVIVQLPTTTKATGDLTKPTEIEVTDELAGDGTFWDAYDLTELVAPIDVPTGGELVIERFDSATQSWVPVKTLSASSMDDIAIDDPEHTTGIRYTYTNADGFNATTLVKPNLKFEARSELRSGGTTTPNQTEPFTPTPYENSATAESTGKLGHREVTGSDEDTANGNLRDPGMVGPGPMWAGKDWKHDLLVSQSGAQSSTRQSWVLAEPGFDRISLSDPVAPSATGIGTVFEAFDLIRVQPIAFAVDPQLRWDTVTAVELFNGTAWVPAANTPANGWMSAAGFAGYTLTGAEQQSTLGVRLVLEPNDAARASAIAAGDLSVPAPGTGVSASGSVRGYDLDWRLRDAARTAAGAPTKWVVSQSGFNCNVTPPSTTGDAGCIDNTFQIAGERDGKTHADSDGDSINLIDGVPNVGIVKTVGGLADGKSAGLTAPRHGDLDQADYPNTWYDITATNTSGLGLGDPNALGIMKLGKVRVTDSATEQLGNPGMGENPFAGRDFAAETASTAGNHFDEFNISRISFADLPAYIDRAQSTVELWLYNGGDPRTESFSIAQIEGAPGGPTAAQLADAIGVSVTYQGTDPEQNGNRIISGAALKMRIDVQLRAEHRVGGAPVVGGSNGAAIPVDNSATALGQDLVIDPTARPSDVDDARVNLTEALIDVRLAKAISVANPAGLDADKIYEAKRDAPVHVVLTATPGGAKAPLDHLVISDATPEFWDVFELVSLPKPGVVPTDGDRYRYEYFAAGADGAPAWISQSDFAGDLADVRGVRIVFDRADGRLFPLGATSWTSNWGRAQLPLEVKLRDTAQIDWSAGLQVTNVADAAATGGDGTTVDADANAGLGFVQGAHRITVQKRAPLDTTSHTVEPLASGPWQLIFTNSGESYLPIETVTDALPASLLWDGQQPRFSQTGGTGLTIDADKIGVDYAEGSGELVFTWPEGSRMAPGEQIVIDLGLILQPGLASSERAWNSVVVETGVDLEACVQPKSNGQDPTRVGALDASQCGNANYVTPRAGTLIGSQKFVNGEAVDTLGEDLVSGGVNVRTGDECDTSPGAPTGYTRTPCADRTAVGATDHWLLRHTNTGTSDLRRLVIVDMLPIPGDRLLAGSAARNSTFRPVIDVDSLAVDGLPQGATTRVEVTTEPTACIGTGGASGWTADPECSNAGANAANGSWTPITDFAGDPQDIAGFRIEVDLGASALRPGKTVDVRYSTVNRVVDQADEGLRPTLAQFSDAQFAWNQNGVVAWDTAGQRVNLPKAAEPAGVTLQTGSIELSKSIVAGGVTQIPESFDVDLVCTVPSGVADPERVELDLGEFSTVTLPADGTEVRIDGLPIGTDCTVSEHGELGSYGEIGRSFQAGDGVVPSEDGTTAELRIREPRSSDSATVVGLTNTYALDEIVVEKSVRSDNGHDLSTEQLAVKYDFELVCTVTGTEAPIVHEFTLGAGEQRTFDDVPQGASCVVTETDAGEATATTVTVAGSDPVEGTSSGAIQLGGDGAHVLVSNSLTGVPPVTPPDPEGPSADADASGDASGDHQGGGTDSSGTSAGDASGDEQTDGLEVTGSSIAGALVAGVLLLALGGATVWMSRRRRNSAA